MNYNLNRKARLTGIFYLLVIILAGFSQGYVRGMIFIPDDPLATLTNINSTEGLFRLGLVSDLLAFMIDAVISILLYQLLKPVNPTLAAIASVFRLLAHPAIASLNLLNHYMALYAADASGPMSALGTEQQEVWAMLFMNAHNAGYLLAGAFFGIHCLLLGILLYRSPLFPKVFGILMVIAAGGYLIETFGNFIFPGNQLVLATIVGFSAAIGEVSFTLYLLFKGSRKTNEQIREQ
ncbi:DUF4386 domain-containing protein [Cyclobacterium sp. 1_MG-2023]|uniref:DUF4386 domain-containing protein n=1 Tax=Cyclobacterium sp. 1_MG-2023 TaxID=3062681 RepID=UPI0026E21318|nr:DUF4386 domain-containing protein [Cyclobacterium sp. 1_MG-2023]MDO6438570.1 DUF4386 domain-containing protein [Cyclobacterium sp. 1_MG-2023]